MINVHGLCYDHSKSQLAVRSLFRCKREDVGNLLLTLTNARIEDASEQWSRAVDLAGKLRTMRLARAESGEAFALLVNNPAIGSPVSLDLRLIEADQVCTPLLRRGRTDEIDGIVLVDGKAICYPRFT